MDTGAYRYHQSPAIVWSVSFTSNRFLYITHWWRALIGGCLNSENPWLVTFVANLFSHCKVSVCEGNTHDASSVGENFCSISAQKTKKKNLCQDLLRNENTRTRTLKLVHALQYWNELLVRVRLAFQNLLQTRQTSRNYQNRSWLWLSIVWKTHKLTRYQPGVKSFLTLLFSSEQTQKFTLTTRASRYYSFTAGN